MDVVTVLTAKGELRRMKSIPEEPETAIQDTEAVLAQATPTKKKARGGAHKGDVAATNARSVKKATRKKKTAKMAHKSGSARKGSKTEKVMELLKRAGGATLKEVMKATGWQAHSVRGFTSGTLGKKMGLTVASVKGEDGQRTYSLKR